MLYKLDNNKLVCFSKSYKISRSDGRSVLIYAKCDFLKVLRLKQFILI